MKKLGIIAALAGALTVARAPTAASDSDLVKKLMERIDALEARLKSIEGHTQQQAKAAEPPAPAPAPAPRTNSGRLA